jgi:GH24 family phage-related lysozyme (muramidase)
MIDAHLITDIDGSENCELVAYRDSRGYWSNGWGHLLGNAKDWTGYTITQVQADAQRGVDITRWQTFASLLPEWHMMDTECRRNALTELCFNMGDRWLSFHDTRAAMDAQDWQEVKADLLDSAWAGQVHATRANRIANYFLTGQYP